MTSKDFQALTSIIQQETREVLQAISPESINALMGKIRNAQRIFVTGKGRTGLQMRSFTMRLMHLGLDAYMLGDVTTPAVGAGDLVLIGSASGRTGSLVSLIEKASALGLEIASITSQPNNPISEASDVKVILPCPTHKNLDNTGAKPSIQPMGGLFEAALSVLLNTVVLMLMDEMGVTEEMMIKRHANLE